VRIRNRKAGALVLWLSLLVLALGASKASAQDVLCTNLDTGSYGHCPPGPYRILSGVETVGTSYGTCSGAWATYPNVFYGSYACQGVASYHPYNAGNTLRGASHNSSSQYNPLTGRQYFVS
jgi:hypothetical protein